MESIQIVALVVFLITIGLIIWGKLDRAVVGLAGAVVMVVLGVMGEKEAFLFVDWNILAILFSVWIIASYFGKSGVPQYLAIRVLRLSRNNIAAFLIFISFLSGFISMFVDNVVTILMMAPVVLYITKRLKLSAFPFIIFLGLAANFMGTALLLGDLPPQMMHSVSKLEFAGFIWHLGRPSSFPLLVVSFSVTAFIMYQFRFRKMYSLSATQAEALAEMSKANPAEHIKNKKFAAIAVGLFLATIVAMSLRQVLGMYLGFIAIAGMIVLVLVNEIFHKKLDSPSFETIITELDWRALMFYAVLFILVGGINHVGIIGMIAQAMSPYFQSNPIVGATLLYWVTAPIVGVVEHDAYILVFLYLIKDLAATAGVNPWPLWWNLLWAGTLGSNLTIAGAPALFVAQSISEREDGRKIPLKEFLSYSVPFVLVSLLVQYILTMLFWVIPFA